ncbi:hypothetical protein B0H11DRAFT_1924472 [Mycena galericulata]|nr:hypothetical protein B0H11DRAFT_1924472 [Mycena galericulata]
MYNRGHESVVSAQDSVVSARDTKFFLIGTSQPAHNRMPPKPTPEYEVLHSGEWWKDYHKNRARRRAHAEARYRPAESQCPIEALEPQQPIVTFIPGRAEPVYSRLAANGALVPLPGSTARTPSVSVPARITTTATHGLPPSKVVARYARTIAPRDPDAELVARLAQSRARHNHLEERQAAAREAKKAHQKRRTYPETLGGPSGEAAGKRSLARSV